MLRHTYIACVISYYGIVIMVVFVIANEQKM
jgi:hypothetical protein